ncbi:MAG: dTDP-4-dehydrorhamnose 3,5-epimerase [Gammaproteobacteria bacterium]|nr:dTDP-4-dehydrorhamnose 3,5-epimerase [Gammaproteobacteria bacterium]MYE81453.1 dTDP-4-dehydrorhamnose 3,5-epimerase [Gammaproteobacteria bacterium]
MRVQELGIADVKVLVPVRHGDRRGFFSEVYNRRVLEAAGIAVDFVQDNHSLSAERGTVRGLHFQIPPFAQTKLVRVVRGSVFDVAVDVRHGSPTFGRHVSVILSAAEGNQVLVPAGFAHGLMTLQADTEVLYKVSDYYAPDHDRGILWNDPALGIDWPVDAARAVLSDKDRMQPRLGDFDTPFEYPSTERASDGERQST